MILDATKIVRRFRHGQYIIAKYRQYNQRARQIVHIERGDQTHLRGFS